MLHRRALSAIVTLLIALLGAGLLGQAPAHAATATISGVVTGEGDGPLDDVDVTVYSYHSDEFDPDAGGWWWETSTTTDSFGRYAVQVEAGADYRLLFDSPQGTGFLDEYYEDSATLADATTLTVAGPTDIDAELGIAGTIVGTVRGEDGRVPDADGEWTVRVDAYPWVESDWNEDGGYWDTDPAVTQSTHINPDTGAYRLDVRPNVRYRVYFSVSARSGYLDEYYSDAATIDEAADLIVGAGETTTADAELRVAGTIAGTVTDEDGQPIEYDQWYLSTEVYVYTYRDDWWQQVGSTWVNSETGAYSIDVEPGVPHRVEFQPVGSEYAPEYFDNATDIEFATDILVDPGETFRADARLGSPSLITGTVTAEGGGPLEGVQVNFHEWKSWGDEPEHGYWTIEHSAFTDEGGRYEVVVEPGVETRLEFEAPDGSGLVGEFWDDADDVDTAQSITVGLGQSQVADAELARGAVLQGMVTGPDGEPASGGGIELLRYDAEWDFWDTAATAWPDENGAYALTAPAGVYRVLFDGTYGDGALLREFHEDVREVEDATDVTLAVGEPLTIDAQLDAAPRLTGRVVDETGAGVAGVEVSLSDVEYGDPGGTALYCEGFGHVRTDDEGYYSYSTPWLGEYKASFCLPDGDLAPTWAGDTADWSEATTFDFTEPGAEETADVTLRPGARISGELTGMHEYEEEWEGEVFDYTDSEYVDIVDVETGEVVRSQHVPGEAGSGTYDVRGLLPGSYTVQFARQSGQSNVPAQFFENVPDGEGADADVLALGRGEGDRNVDAQFGAPGVISGQVVDAEGVPVPHVTVHAYTQDESLVTRSTFADEDGLFEVSGLSTGAYRLAVDAPAYVDGAEYYDGDADLTVDESEGEVVDVVLGETVELADALVYGTDDDVDPDPNTAPTAAAVTGSTAFETAVTLTLDGADADGDALTYEIVDAPSAGTASINGNRVTFTPASGFSGQATFTYRAFDGVAGSAPAMVSVSVAPRPNTAPTASNLSASTDFETAVSIPLSGVDADGDPLTYELVGTPVGGSATVSGAAALFTPASGFSGSASFSYRASDGQATSPSATVTVTVGPRPNRAPTVSAVTGATAFETPVAVTLAGADADGDPLTYEIVGTPVGGTATVSGSAATFTPASGFSGSASFSYRASDGRATSSPATVTVAVAEPPEEPEPDLVSVTPGRLMDTRPGQPTADGQASGGGVLRAGTARTLQITGRYGIPADGVGAVALNVTAIRSSVASHLTVWPTGAAQPTASNLNFTAGQVIPNLVVVKVGDGGKISLATAAGSVDVAVDVAGWYPEDGSYTPLTPGRLLDTRAGQSTVDNQAAGGGAVRAGSPRSLQITGRYGIPASGVGAVVLNVTAIRPSASSHLTVWPTGSAQPTASNLNFTPGQVIPNLVIVKVGANGRVDLANAAGAVDVAVDVAGWFPDDGDFTPLTPGRLMDTRTGQPTVDGQAAGGGVLAGGATRSLQITGRYGIPASGVGAVVLNVTAIRPSASSHLTVWPTGAAKPTASNLNFTAGQVIPNLVIVKVGANGRIDLANAAGDVNVAVDVAGWFPAD